MYRKKRLEEEEHRNKSGKYCREEKDEPLKFKVNF
jgi:hypothetical protein